MESLEKKTCEACTIDAPKVTDAEKIDFLDQIKEKISTINNNYEFKTLPGHVPEDVLIAYIP